jgi:hypothetical protein
VKERGATFGSRQTISALACQRGPKQSSAAGGAHASVKVGADGEPSLRDEAIEEIVEHRPSRDGRSFERILGGGLLPRKVKPAGRNDSATGDKKPRSSRSGVVGVKRSGRDQK